MPEARKLVMQLLIIIRNLDKGEPKLKDIEIVKNEKGEITGYRILISEERSLKLIKGEKG